MCQLEWIGIVEWWCQIGASGQAAWVQAIASLLTILAVVFVAFYQRHLDRIEKARLDKKIVMSIAANLDIALSYESAWLAFSPVGGDDNGYTLRQAQELMRLSPQTKDILQNAIDKSHYFSEKLCERIVQLGIEASSYEQSIDTAARHSPDMDAAIFFNSIQHKKNELNARLIEVREYLQLYLPKC